MGIFRSDLLSTMVACSLIIAACNRGDSPGGKTDGGMKTSISARAPSIEQGVEETVVEGTFELTGVELKEEYPWEEGGYDFLSHFREVEEGWKLPELLEHSGMPAPYEELEVFAEKWNKKIETGKHKSVLTYGIPPPPEGGFHYRCDITLLKGIVTEVKLDWGHVSLIPGARVVPKYNKK